MELKHECIMKNIRIEFFKDFDTKKWKIKFYEKGDDDKMKEFFITDADFNKNPITWKIKGNDEKIIEYFKKIFDDYLKWHNYDFDQIPTSYSVFLEQECNK